jgi:hypothetical protein
MSALDGMEWRDVGCGNPDHGPSWECWKVKSERDDVVLRGVNKATAERHAAFPDLVRALLENMERRADGTLHHRTECSANDMTTCDAPRCASARAALEKAAVRST